MKFICHIFRVRVMSVQRHFQHYFMVKETGVLGENHQPVACNWKTLSNNVVPLELASGWEEFELTTLVVIGTDCICSCKYNYVYDHATMVPVRALEMGIKVSLLTSFSVQFRSK
jgi:hypothetical protein